MAENLAELFLVCSLFGLGFIIYKKIPIFRELPESEFEGSGLKEFFLRLKGRVNVRKYLPSKAFWEKAVLKIRILAQKVENKTFVWQRKLKEKSKKEEKTKDFWDNLKKLKKE